MSDARADILAGIRASLARGPLDASGRAALDRRVGGPPEAVRAPPDREGRVALFRDKAEAVSATTARIASLDDLPGAVSDYLAAQNLPSAILATPDPLFDAAPWDAQPLLSLKRGVPGIDDLVALTCAHGGVAETGSLVMWHDKNNPHSASFVPETNIVVLPASRVVGSLEEAWAGLRAAATPPRALCFITGPSRTGDIGLRIELGAHGPRRLHVVIVDDVET